MAKTLIAFFSRADENYFGGTMRYIEVGNTEIAAGKIKERIDADIFKIEMKTPYAKDYNTCIDQAKKDKQNDARPELAALPDSIDGYDTVILAYPNYWSTMPMAVFTFLDAFSFAGKKILPLCTNEGSGMGTSESDIKKLCAGADVKKGLALNGSSINKADVQIETWLKTNGLM
ncbi:MAG: NAD(P)H-dependent oxidoreductase [Firmicutes bacterium]|nr:NAD(P)H-dependent oxidoreductase [Bacillota bacterium]